MEQRDVIARAAADWDPGSEETLEQAIKRWANCSHAEVHFNGDVYIEDPQDGHYLDDDRLEELAAWMRAEGMLPDRTDQTIRAVITATGADSACPEDPTAIDADIFCDDNQLGGVTLVRNAHGDLVTWGHVPDCWASDGVWAWCSAGDGEWQDDRITAVLEAVSDAALAEGREVEREAR